MSRNEVDHILFGAAYYDEYLMMKGIDRIDEDMKMMKAAGLNVIRIAESTWSTCEPQPGVFDFTYVDRALDAANRAGIDVIVGFPGETEDDFARTCKLVERCGFMRLHVFRYSKRPGTPAAIRDDQVDPKIKAARSQILIDLGRRLALSDMERRLGTIEEVVIERPGIGTSESYHAVACDTALPVGALVEVEFSDIDTDTMRLIGR